MQVVAPSLVHDVEPEFVSDPRNDGGEGDLLHLRVVRLVVVAVERTRLTSLVTGTRQQDE